MIICEPSKCTGCGACANVCPKSCITMGYNENLELSPTIGEACIECGLCQKTCPINNAVQFSDTHKCYAGYSLNQRKTSSSGGLASALATYFVQNGGNVSGCVFDGDVHHIVTMEQDGVVAMRGSKYVQSQPKDCYRTIKRLIKDSKCLFIGTPCQVAGVRAVVGNSDNLYCVDLICHGTPSPKYLQQVIGQDGCQKISFRNKGDFALRIDDQVTDKGERYMMSFLAGLTFRDACYDCPFARNARVGDLTIGDFWEIEGFDDAGKGVSCILVNTPKGEELLGTIEDELYLQERTLEEAYRGNPQLVRPSTRHKNRDKYLEILHKTGDFDQAVKPNIRKERLKNWLKKQKVVQVVLKLKNRKR